ncbi:hypothetical protein [Streptomyces jumonjinensis]|uniref:hypothetical protein n=1 Tax=Streptomyces jumonjinensis TaxID=1945 RepID=UPI0018865163|nr:hypothetical protein [Streptomyces jumonjinensis]
MHDNTCTHCNTQLQHDAYLCDPCTAHTSRRLQNMPALYAALAGHLAPGRSGTQYGRIHHGGRPGIPVAEAPLVLRGPGGIVGTLEGWRSVMQEDRGWGQPALSGTIERRVAVAARGLEHNLDWITASWPLAGEFAGEIRDLERQILTIAGPIEPAERGHRLGPCPTLTTEGSPCGAILRARPGQATITCTWCSTTYPPGVWGQLAERIVRLEAADEQPEPVAA